MLGPQILARTMSVATKRGGKGRTWQYHSRSDAHSKVACWTLLFDLLLECDAFRSAAERGNIGFAINHLMVGTINKTLDLVIGWTPEHAAERVGLARRRTFLDMAEIYGIRLEETEQRKLAKLPVLEELTRTDTSEVAVAIEAKACMTEHVKSLPRLHAEILATGYLAKLAVRDCITVSYSMVNAAHRFVTPSADGKVNLHAQPSAASQVVEMLSRAVPLWSQNKDFGYDAIGVTVVDCENEGQPVSLIEDPRIGPRIDQPTHYERMVQTICSRFRARFGRS